MEVVDKRLRIKGHQNMCKNKIHNNLMDSDCHEICKKMDILRLHIQNKTFMKHGKT